VTTAISEIIVIFSSSRTLQFLLGSALFVQIAGNAIIGRRPFGNLLHFAKDVSVPQPKVLVVAPLSGHFATLLRATVATLSRDHDVYLTDWHNATADAWERGCRDALTTYHEIWGAPHPVTTKSA